MAKLEPKDGNIEKYEADILKNTSSFQAYYEHHANKSVYSLIQYFAEAMAYQYSINRFNETEKLEYVKIIRETSKEDAITVQLLSELKLFFEQVDIGDTAEDYKSLYRRIKIMIRAIESPDILPTAMEYGDLLRTIIDKEDISDLAARAKYGKFTYAQWNKIL